MPDQGLAESDDECDPLDGVMVTVAVFLGVTVVAGADGGVADGGGVSWLDGELAGVLDAGVELGVAVAVVM